MKMKKTLFLIVTCVLVVGMLGGCQSKVSFTNDSNETNTTVPGMGEREEGDFSGEVLGNFLEELAGSVGGEVESDAIGYLLSLLGWGSSGNSQQNEVLANINHELDVIAEEISYLEGEFAGLIKNVLKKEDRNLLQELWPTDAVKDIANAKSTIDNMRYENNLTVGLGEANQTKIINFANAWIEGTGEHSGMGMADVGAIYDSVNGTASADNIGIFSLYVERALINLGFDHTYLWKGYQSLESFASRLLGYQASAVNYTAEAYRARKDEDDADASIDCFYKANNLSPSCNILYNEVANIDKKYSFMYNAISLVLQDAPFYDTFLHSEAEEILKRAEFYTLTVRGVKTYGVHIFHISTADMPKSPDTLYIAKERTTFYPCTPTRHVVEGRIYDTWTEGNKVETGNDYNVVEYVCEEVPNGLYGVFDSEVFLGENILGSVSVKQYDASYRENSSGDIRYGFGVVAYNMPDHYPLSSPNWSIQKPSADNYHSYVDIHFPKSWSIVTKAEYHAPYESKRKARVELDGHFNYNGVKERTMYIDYSAQIYVKAKAQKYSDAYAYSHYTVGVYDCDYYGPNKGKVLVEKENFTLEAGPGHSYYGPRNIGNYMQFKAKPGHGYYFYINLVSSTKNKDIAFNPGTPMAWTNLNEIYHIYVMFNR